MTDTNPTPADPTFVDPAFADDDATKPIDLGDGWIAKDGDVIEKDVDDVLPEARPAEGPAPLP